jgi:hypothetical protein
MSLHTDGKRQVRKAPPGAAKSMIAPVQIASLRTGGPEEALEQIAKRARQAVEANLVAILAEVPGGMHVLGGVDGTSENDLRGLVLGAGQCWSMPASTASSCAPTL